MVTKPFSEDAIEKVAGVDLPEVNEQDVSHYVSGISLMLLLAKDGPEQVILLCEQKY
ncbi:hypothetical protein [Citrobacter europaeus]|uniref:hypothetical protein n=1 Tax=Citrobacter europaeus TaxID=1914243 RepID=UPI000AE033C8|nr:hypothetical protein [Citrobacter europaeus]